MTHKFDINHVRPPNQTAYVPITTADGSCTLLNHKNHLHFRSLRGAISESEYVFYEGSNLISQPCAWSVLELGLGTGLNFLVTASHAIAEKRNLAYHVVELDPLPLATLQILHTNHPFPKEVLQLLLEALNHCGTTVQINYQGICLSLHIYRGDWQTTNLPDALKVQAIYHDPFGPKDNPNCWTQACFDWSVKHLSPEGRLVTYAANTQLRREMVNAGLYIGSLPGAHGKREMTLAAKHLKALTGTTICRHKSYFINHLDRRPPRC